jgi:hypothetical protein
MRYRVELPHWGATTENRGTVHEVIEAHMVECCGGGALLLYDDGHYLRRAFASGHWVSLTLLEEDGDQPRRV